MTPTQLMPAGTIANPLKRYRLPGIEREGIAQLSLLETALWPLQGGKLPSNKFETQYSFTTNAGRKNASVTVRAASGLQPIDELILWGLLGATLARFDAEPLLLATPYWMLRHLGLETGGSQYAELRESLLRLAFTSYQNDGFYNPESQEHEYAAFQFLSILLPTVAMPCFHARGVRCVRARRHGGRLSIGHCRSRCLRPFQFKLPCHV